MAISSAMSIAKSAVLGHQDYLSVLGQNIANVNTNGYKGQRIEFSTMISQRLQKAQAPTGERGGINPQARGLGAKTATFFRSFVQGNVEATEQETDFAINGKGFFPLSPLNADGTVPDSQQFFYTRDGSFNLGLLENADGSSSQTLVHKGTGLPILGQAAINDVVVDPADGVITSALTPITIPLGQTMPATQTSNIFVGGNFDATGISATQGSQLTSNFFLAGNTPATAASDLSSVFDGSGNALFGGITTGEAANVTLSIGGRDYTQSFVYGTDGTTLSDFGNFINSNFLNTAVSDGAGVAFVGNQLQVTGNLGDKNSIDDITVAFGTSSAHPFTIDQLANGESQRIVLTPIDSLGVRHDVDITFVKNGSTTNAGQSWSWYANSLDDSSGGMSVGNGTFTFNADGSLASQSSDTITLDLDSGATTPFTFNMSFLAPTNQADDGGSSPILLEDDGIDTGIMTEFAVNTDGRVLGIFSNGQRLELSRIPVATFTNESAMLAEGDNLFRSSLNSGDLILRIGKTGRAGSIQQFAIENSNVELANELTRMIQAQRAFQANTRTITTDDEMIQEALSLLR